MAVKAQKSKRKTQSKAPRKAKSRSKPRTMEELLAQADDLNVPKRGDKIEGIVTDISKKMMLVDIGGKTEGMVVDKEFELARDLIDDLSIGDKIEVYVVTPENDRGQILLSLKEAAQVYSWDKFRQYLETGEMLMVKGLEVNKGGVVVRADGMRGFIPSSQFGSKLAGKLEDLINRSIKVKVIEADQEKNRLIFSERHVSEADQIAKRNKALDKIKEGEVFEGLVSGIMPFGIFVTVKAGEAKIEGLVHISQISWEKIDDPGKLFKLKDKVKVKVIGIDAAAGRLNLSIKQLKDDPWKSVLKNYTAGSKHKGEVTRVEQFGVFVNLEPGIDGLVHISKIPAGEEPEVGDKLDVLVESVDPEQRRMSLSLVLKKTERVMYK